MRAGRHIRRIVIAGLVAGTAGIGLVSVTASGAATKSHVGPEPTKTIIFAEGAGANPNYIFPYENCNFFSVDNINQFQDLMFRPLYWFGIGANAAYVPSLSIANKPVESAGGKTWTLTMKNWKFASGQTTDAESAKFFLDMYKADPSGALSGHVANGGGYCGYNAGYGIPDQLIGVTASGQTLTLHFSVAIANVNWMIYNNLSQITPMPETWDITADGNAAGTGGCAAGAFNASSTNTACIAVENYLDGKSGDTTSYTGALWQSGDDGPWKLTSFDSLGNASFVPNTTYSGPQKAIVGHFNEKSYSSYSAEQSDLSAHSIQLGYLDSTTAPCCSVNGNPGPNPYAANYNLITGPEWGFNYAVLNEGLTGVIGAELSQRYVRVALQEGIDSIDILKALYHGYGTNTWSPLPIPLPASLGTAPKEQYPSSATSYKAGLALLQNNGWKLTNGKAFCVKAGIAKGDCGKGITKGAVLSFHLLMLPSSQCPSCAKTYTAEVDNWKKEGFQVSIATGSFNSIIAQCGAKGKFQICSWGGGWIYAPDFEPTGESLFASTGGFNIGHYVDHTMDSLIHNTDYGTANLTAYGLYAAQQVPVLFEPTQRGIGETAKTIKGVQPPNPLGNLMPEYLYY